MFSARAREAVEAGLRAPRRLERVQRGGVGQRGRVHQREVRALPELRAEGVRGVAEQHERAVVPVPRARRCDRTPAAAAPSTTGRRSRASAIGASESRSSRNARTPASRTASIRSSRTDQNTDTALAPVGRKPTIRRAPSKYWSRQPGERCRRVVEHAPQRAPAVLVDAGAVREEAPHRRARAVGADDPGVRAVARAARVDQRPVLAPDDLDAGQDRRARRARPRRAARRRARRGARRGRGRPAPAARRRGP